VVEAVVLRSLPYRHPEQLVSFFEDLGKLGYPRNRVSAPTYLGLKAQTRVFVIGTTFLPEEDRPGQNHVVLLSFSLWQNDFASNANIIGQTIRWNDELYTVKGVMPPFFSFPGNIS